MLNIEKTKIKIELAELKSTYRELDLEAKGLIQIIRLNLNPYEEDITKLNIEETYQAASRLKDIKQRLLKLKEKISVLETALNG